MAVVWPFAVAVLLGHAGVARANLARDRIWPGGVVVVAATYLLGMALRVVSGRGLAVAFLVVALLFLVATMLGWRAVRAAVAGRRSRS